MGLRLKEYRARCEEDVGFFLANEFKIQASIEAGYSGTEIIPLRENVPQADLRQTIAVMLKEAGKAWIQLLKARQWGGSTEFQGHVAHALAFKPRTQALLVSYSDESTAHILEIAKRGLDNLDLLRDELIVPKSRGTTFRLRNGSKLTGITAGGGKGTHSFTYHVSHLSERSRWDRHDEVMTGVGPAIKNAWLVLDESTAAGASGGFHDDWKRGQTLQQWLASPPSRRTHVNVFVPYYRCEWYTQKTTPEQDVLWRDRPGELVQMGLIDAESVEVGRKYNLTLGQVLWRLATIQSKACQGKVEKFIEQYPVDPETCWLAGGRKVFGASLLRARFEATEPPPRAFEVQDDLVPDADGPLWIWAMPEDGHEYVIGVDPSVSEQGKGFGGVQMLDASDDLAQVAEYNAPRTPRDLARIVSVLGALYHTALVSPERRNHGAAFIDSLVNEYGYTNVYQFVGDGLTTPATASPLLGIDTHSKVRGLIFQEGRTSFPLLRTRIRSARMVEEASNLQLDEEDGLKRIQSQRTDLWWSWCFAVYAARRMGLVRSLDRKKEGEKALMREIGRPSPIEGQFWDPSIGGYW